MPLLSPKMTEGTIAKWVKKEGDKMSPGEALCEVEMDMAAIEMESMGDHYLAKVECIEESYLAKIVHDDGAKEIKVGEIICLTVKEEAYVEKFKDYKPLSAPMIVPLSIAQDRHTEAYKSYIEDNLGGIAESTAPSQGKQVKRIWVNSAILAAHSSVFHQMFTVGLQEATRKVVKYQISIEEEDIMMRFLEFLYTSKLNTTDPCLLLNISRVADFFAVKPLVKHCIQLLISQPMSEESALMYLDYPYPDGVAEETDCLIELARQFLVTTYKFLNRIPNDMLDLPLAGIEAIFGSTKIHVDSEDDIYDFLIKWLCHQYAEPNERQSIWTHRLLPIVRFGYVSRIKLQEVLAANFEGLLCAETLRRITNALISSPTTSRKEQQRQYTYKPVSTTELEGEMIIYLDLTKEEISKLKPGGHLRSIPFSFSGQKLYLAASRECDPATSLCYFGFWVGKEGHNGEDALIVDLHFAKDT